MRRARIAVMAAAALGVAAPPALAQSAWQIEAGAGSEKTSGPSPDWQQQDLSLRWLPARRQRLELQARRAERYGMDDREIALSGTLPLAEAWTLVAQAHGSPEHRFLPQRGFGAGLAVQWGGGWVADGGYATRRFVAESGFTSSSSTWRGTVERYVADWRAAATLTHTRISGSGDGAIGVALQVDRYFGDVGRVGIAVASGEELEALPGGLVSSRVNTVALLARAPLAPRWALVGALVHTRQGDFERRMGGATTLPDTRRSGGRLGVQHDF